MYVNWPDGTCNNFFLYLLNDYLLVHKLYKLVDSSAKTTLNK
jgi:hypothetical protein